MREHRLVWRLPRRNNRSKERALESTAVLRTLTLTLTLTLILARATGESYPKP